MQAVDCILTLYSSRVQQVSRHGVLCNALTHHKVHVKAANAKHAWPALQDSVLLTFSQQATGISWEAYIRLYCAGAQLLYLHEKPRMEVDLERLIL